MITRFLRFIYPERCNLCSKVTHLGSYPICRDCKQEIKEAYIKKTFNESIHFLGSVVEFTPITKKIIHKLKYKKKEIVAKILAREIFNRVIKKKKIHIDFVLPVPINKHRRFFRGFNQTDLIAIELSKLIKCKCNRLNLIRLKDTKTQTKLDKSQRKENMVGVFELLNPIIFNNKSILIVDDVITTGATIESCREVLLKNGAKSVYTASFARAL